MKTTELTCPHCKSKTNHPVHDNATVVGYQCSSCNKAVVHSEESCCAICDYSEGKCPLHKEAQKEEVNG